MRTLGRIADQLLAWWKWALSFRSRNWELEDYPIHIRRQDRDPNSPSPFENNPRFRLHRYVARIINWYIDGMGDTKEDALSDLRTKFLARKATLAEEGKTLPRPGTKVPIQFASQEQVSAHPDLKADFIRRVLELEWAFISDESSLWDFHTEETNEALLAKIKDVYGVSVADIESGNIYKILNRITEAQQTK